MFSCIWLHFKKCFEKYFLIFGCVLENTIENTFCTCCSHFLIFSRLPNDYIISFIPQNTKKKPKKKKNHQNRTLREIAIGAKARSRSAQSVLRAKRRSRSKLRAIGAVLVMSADNIGKLGFGRSLLSLLSFSLSLFLSLSLSLSPIFQGRKLFEVKMETEMISRCFGSHFRSTENAFQFDRI